MDPMALLKEDHSTVLDLIDQLEEAQGTGNHSEAAKLFDQLNDALTLHTRIEEAVLYPALEAFTETTEAVKLSVEEHEEVSQLLVDLSDTHTGEAEFEDRFAELRERVQSHIEEEEDNLLPDAERLLGERRLQEMGRQIEQLRKGKLAASTRLS